jgi:alpha-1,2-mannosyltransferase
MPIPSTVTPGRLGASVGAVPHHATPNPSIIVDVALRSSLVTGDQVPLFALSGAVALVVVVVGVLSPALRQRLAGILFSRNDTENDTGNSDHDNPDDNRGAGGWRARLGVGYRFPPLVVVVVGVGVASTVLWAVHSYHVSPRGFVDLNVYRLGVTQWWHGGDLYGVLPRTGVGLLLPFTYPPFAVTVLSALALPSWTASIIGIMTVSLVCLCVVVYLTVRTVWRGGGVRGALVMAGLAVPLALFLEPVDDTIWFGQVNLVLMTLVVVDLLLVDPKWPRGTLVGIAVAIKLTPVVFLLYFLLRKDYRAAITMAITAAVATAVGFVVTWSGSLGFWFGATGGAHAVGDPASPLNQSVTGALARLDVTGHTRTVVWLALVAFAAVFAIVGIRRASRSDEPVVAMVVTAGLGLLASPISWGHHWVYVVPAIIAMVAKGVQERRWGWLAAAAAAIAVYHLAPFLELDPANTWPPLSFVEGNSFVLLDIALLVLFGGRTVLRHLSPGRAPLGRRTSRLPATVSTVPARTVAETARTTHDA